MPTTTSLIDAAIPRSPPPCLGSARDSSSRIAASSLARSYRDGSVGRTGTARPFSSTDTASGNMNSSGARRRFVDSLRKAVWRPRRPVQFPSDTSSPSRAVHSDDEKTAAADEADAAAAPELLPR